MALSGNSQFQKLPLSGGTTNGRRIKVVATADPGTTIHTGSTDTSITDEIWLHAYNSDTSSRTLTLEWGGSTSPDDMVVYTLAAGETRVLDISGLILVGASTPLVLKAFTSAANVITLNGYVNRMQ